MIYDRYSLKQIGFATDNDSWVVYFNSCRGIQQWEIDNRNGAQPIIIGQQRGFGTIGRMRLYFR